MTTLLVEDIGLLVHGDSASAPLRDTMIVVEDGVIAASEPAMPHRIWCSRPAG